MNFDDNHAIRQLVPMFTALRQAITDLRRAVGESADMMKSATHAMLSM